MWKRTRGGHPGGASRWSASLPGQHNFPKGDWDVPYLGQRTSEAAFLASEDYVYQTWEYEVDEPCEGRRRVAGTADPPGHCDNQREGAELGLFFLRMLLSHIAPSRYPTPRLDDRRKIPTLPFPGVEPFSPRLLDATARHWSRYDEPTFEVHGDNEEALDVAPGRTLENVFFTATSTREDRLRLDAWKVAVEGGRERIRLQARTNLGGFDRVALATNGGNTVLVAQRAEGKRTVRPDLHWLRLDVYTLHGAGLSKVATWQSGIRESGSVQSLEAAMLDSTHAAVMFKSKSRINRLRLFSIDYARGSITPLGDGINVQEGGSPLDPDVELAAIGDRVVYAVERPGIAKFRLSTRRRTGASFSSPVSTPEIRGTLFDIAVVRSRYSPNPFIVAAAWAGSTSSSWVHLYLHAWELTGSGELVYRGTGVGSVVGEKHDPRTPIETNYSHAKIIPFDLPLFDSSRQLGPGFVVVGRGPAVVTRTDDGDPRRSGLALKVLYARLMRDGRPTIESFNVAGGDDLGEQLGGAGAVCTSRSCGVVTGHRTGNDHLSLIHWAYEDPFASTRWER